jgi:uncharacterized membrane protein YeaQ/YmgE (transglycosylase-associated protein family)
VAEAKTKRSQNTSYVIRDLGYNSFSKRCPVKRRRVEVLGALLFWIIVGLIAGVIAKVAMPGDDPGGIIVTIVIGIVGAILGGWLLSLIGIGGGAGSGGFIFSIIAGAIGAVILLAIYRVVANRAV